MRIALLILAACSTSSPPPAQTPVPRATRPPPNDTSFFPASWPALRRAEDATEPTRAVELARKALNQLDEERGLSTQDAAHQQAYDRLVVRMRIIQNNALLAGGHSFDALADVVRSPFECPPAPAHARDACDRLTAALATAFPNVIAGAGRIKQVDQTLVLDDATSAADVKAFMQKASALQGSVIQRMRVASTSAGVVKISPLLQLRVATKQRLGGGAVVWVAFEPRKIRPIGKAWDVASAQVLFVEGQ